MGGLADLDARLVRAVGNAAQRFAEDKLRLLRAVRFAARPGFHLEDKTRAAIAEQASQIAIVSAERIGDEIERLLTEGNARGGFEMLEQTGLLAEVMPEIVAMKGVEQSPEHHPEGDVFVHTMLCLEKLEAGVSTSLALGVLLHDVAKPLCAEVSEDGRRTFYGHCERGAEIAVEICRRLRRSNAVADRVEFLVAQHLRPVSAPDMRASTLKKFLRQDGIEELLELLRIDSLSSSGNLDAWEFCRQALASLPPEVIRPKPLITGQDLIAMGCEPGPLFGRVLRAVEDAQLNGELIDAEQARAFAAEQWESAIRPASDDTSES